MQDNKRLDEIANAEIFPLSALRLLPNPVKITKSRGDWVEGYKMAPYREFYRGV